ncbi:Lrp/AsnC family transcriptional regulator [Candidatus Woesearchaeota archaeon]|nr:Lrp/AsnC family transcriptional regulator [Candidatus Woesearchaeota archaeon]
MSRKTRIPVSTIYDRLKSFEGVLIRKNSSLLNFSKLGFVVRALVIFSVEKSQRDEFSSCLLKNNNVNSLYRINNGYDFVAEILHKDINDLEHFMDSLVERFKVRERKTFFVIDELKKEGFLTDENFLDII